MKLLIVDRQGAALDFSMRAQRAGHQVKHFIYQTEKTRFIGRGLTPLVDDFRPWLRWADLIFSSDNTHYLRELDVARREGIKVIGPTQETAEWELDREKGMSVLRKAGVACPPYKTFSKYDDALNYVRKEMRRFVSKPSGDDNKALSYVAKSPQDLVYMIERWKKADKLKGEFILQEFIPGVEMAVGGWFGPGGFNRGFLENFEFKKLMNDDLGVNTGEQGTVIRYVRSSKLARKVLEPIGDQLERANYVGYIDVNCIIDDKGTPWPLEFTMRPGWPTFNIQQVLHDGDPVEWLYDLANGRDARSARLDEIAIGVVLSIPDYPYSHLTRKEVCGVPIYGLTPGMEHYIHPCETMMGAAPKQIGNVIANVPMMVTAGDYVLVVTACGDTVLNAKEKVYRRVDRIEIPNSPMWRTDIGDRLGKQLPKLQAMGYAQGMRFS